MNLPVNIPIQEVEEALLRQKSVRVFLKREDLLHEKISGNKWRKLHYNLQYAKSINLKTLVTFGGAFSNHISATAAAGKEFGFKTIGVIRGEEYAPLNPTLHYAHSCGMELRYVDRSAYREKTTKHFEAKYLSDLEDYYLIPEGGTNTLAVKGCEEILSDVKFDFDVVCCACGTGGTVSGIINSLKPHQAALAFSSLKGANFLKDEIGKYVINSQWSLNLDYHFGGYAKVDRSLVDFINRFKLKHNISLDPVYTGKMMYGLWDLIENDYFRRGSTIIAIHTGGLQGVLGMNERIKDKGLQIL
ncbi:MAG: pyridoxal-phosphate dependent enzyme [Flavobacteriales bacterium]|nr:pyridoxal-phosphate dependent enzyme [Flavobacteriales bacterium]